MRETAAAKFDTTVATRTCSCSKRPLTTNFPNLTNNNANNRHNVQNDKNEMMNAVRYCLWKNEVYN